jgi:metal-dependent amidase/aminoacylase/carboxypeptidase family protein
MNNNAAIAAAYKANALALGRKFLEIPVDSTGSSDMGNVSWVVPSIHPTFGIGQMGLNHTPGFTQISAADDAHKAMLEVAQALAMTGVELVLDADLLARAQAEFRGAPRP